MTEAIKREMRRRPAIEPAIGHAKSEHRMGRNYPRRRGRRRHQRRPCRRGIQFPPPSGLVQSFVVCNLDGAHRSRPFPNRCSRSLINQSSLTTGQPEVSCVRAAALKRGGTRFLLDALNHSAHTVGALRGQMRQEAELVE